MGCVHHVGIATPMYAKTVRKPLKDAMKYGWNQLPESLSFLRNQIERMAHGRRWKLLQERPEDYLFVIGASDIRAIPKAS